MRVAESSGTDTMDYECEAIVLSARSKLNGVAVPRLPDNTSKCAYVTMNIRHGVTKEKLTIMAIKLDRIITIANSCRIIEHWIAESHSSTSMRFRLKMRFATLEDRVAFTESRWDRSL